MTVGDKIKASSLALAGHMEARDVRIGLVYTAVLLENDQPGLAYTFHRDLTGGCTAFKGIRPLAGRKASELVQMLDSSDKIESAVALATSNALSNTMKTGLLEGDILEHLNLQSQDRVGMVGHFAPLVPLIRKRVSSIKIFEQIDRPRGDLLPQWDAFKILPHCHVALITSTSILNQTIDGLLDAAQSCRAVALLGASTPLIPEAFAGTPVTILSGVVVTRPKELLQIVSEGGGMRLFKDSIRKVNILLPGYLNQF